MNEERILDKLDSIESKNTTLLVEVAKIQEQMKEVPDLKNRVSALEKWRWTAVGALCAAGTSLGTQFLKVVA